MLIFAFAGAHACSGTVATGDGGADGVSTAACQEIAALDHACASDSDCAAVHHMTNCCGGMAWIGVRATDLQAFAMLEQQCVDSYPPCGCFDGRDNTDDGSRIPVGGTAAVTCQAGLCKTYAPACGQSCAAGSSCRTCTDTATGVTTSACAPQCTDDSMCDPAAPRCNLGFGSGLCAPATASCEQAG